MEPDYDVDEPEPWCRHFDAHTAWHRFCEDHQVFWCRMCDEQCPDCVHDPHCRWCHCALFEEDHEWDCPHANE